MNEHLRMTWFSIEQHVVHPAHLTKGRGRVRRPLIVKDPIVALSPVVLEHTKGWIFFFHLRGRTHTRKRHVDPNCGYRGH